MAQGRQSGLSWRGGEENDVNEPMYGLHRNRFSLSHRTATFPKHASGRGRRLETRRISELAMICRIWRGWTTPQNADAYESVVRAQVIPRIEALRIDGFRHIDLLRRASDREVEFATIMWFDDLAAVRRFMGDDYEVSHVPLAAQAVLARFDERAAHYDVIDRRSQGG